MVARGAARALDILEAFEKLRRPSRLTELAALTGMPVSTCHGLISTLKARGYLQAVRGEIYPTARMARLASSVSSSVRLADELRPTLLRLRDVTGETALACTLVGRDVVRVAVVESASPVRFVARPGSRVEAAASAAGLALLAGPETGFAEAGSGAARVGDVHAVTSRHGHDQSDVRSIGVAAKVQDDWVGIEVAGPVDRMRPAFASDLVHAINEALGR